MRSQTRSVRIADEPQVGIVGTKQHQNVKRNVESLCDGFDDRHRRVSLSGFEERNVAWIEFSVFGELLL